MGQVQAMYQSSPKSIKALQVRQARVTSPRGSPPSQDFSAASQSFPSALQGRGPFPQLSRGLGGL